MGMKAKVQYGIQTTKSSKNYGDYNSLHLIYEGFIYL
jgi:hypothetical protein